MKLSPLSRTIATILMAGAVTSMAATPVLAEAAAPSASPTPDIYVPGWVTYCAPYLAKNLVCTIATFNTYYPNPPYTSKPTLPAATAPSYTPGNWGTTAAGIEADFPVNLVGNFRTNPNINAQMTAIQLPMLAAMSISMHRLDPSNTYLPSLLELAAQKLSATNLVTFRGAFGTALDTYVADYAPAAVKTAYDAAAKINPIWLSNYYYVAKGLARPTALTINSYAAYDTFLLTYTYQSDTPNVAVHKAVQYLQIRAKFGLAEAVGVAGLAIAIILFFDPDAWNDIVNEYNQLTSTPPPNTTQYPGLQPTLPTIIALPPLDDLPDPTIPVFPPIDFGPDVPWGVCSVDSPC
jgi:hypothetical protein